MIIDINNSYLYWVKYSFLKKEYILFQNDDQRDNWLKHNKHKFGKVELKNIQKIIKYKKVHICNMITLTKERELLTKIMELLENGN
jgi:hypothetical protein